MRTHRLVHMQGMKRLALFALLTACGGKVDGVRIGEPLGGAAGNSGDAGTTSASIVTSGAAGNGAFGGSFGGSIATAPAVSNGGATAGSFGGSIATAPAVSNGGASVGTTAGSFGGSIATAPVAGNGGASVGTTAESFGGSIATAPVAGNGGASVGTTGVPSSCAGTAGTCPAQCAAVPVLHAQGCSTPALRENICMPTAPTIEAPACGIQAATGEVYRLDSDQLPPPSSWGSSSKNPFATIAGFRACNQAEIDASNCWPAEERSTQKVTFLVTNEASEDRYLAKSGSGCTPYSVERGPIWTGLILGVDPPSYPPSICVCSTISTCDSGSNATYVRLVPGASDFLEWDAREMRLFELLVNCSSASDQHEPYGIPTRVGPGPYRITVGYETDGPGYGTPSGSGVQFLCHSHNKVSKEFTLPDSGDLVVPISLR